MYENREHLFIQDGQWYFIVDNYIGIIIIILIRGLQAKGYFCFRPKMPTADVRRYCLKKREKCGEFENMLLIRIAKALPRLCIDSEQVRNSESMLNDAGLELDLCFIASNSTAKRSRGSWSHSLRPRKRAASWSTNGNLARSNE